jgi:hypothetical protein
MILVSDVKGLRIYSSVSDKSSITIELDINIIDYIGINQTTNLKNPEYWLFFIVDKSEYGHSINIDYHNFTNYPIYMKEFSSGNEFNLTYNVSYELLSGYLFYTVINPYWFSYNQIDGRITINITGDLSKYGNNNFKWNGADYPFDEYSVESRIIFFRDRAEKPYFFSDYEFPSLLKSSAVKYEIHNPEFVLDNSTNFRNNYVLSYSTFNTVIKRTILEMNIVTLFIWLMFAIFALLSIQIINGEATIVLLTTYLLYLTPSLFIFGWLINKDPMIDSFVIIFGILVLISTFFLLLKSKITSLPDTYHRKDIAKILIFITPFAVLFLSIYSERNIIPYITGFLLNPFSLFFIVLLGLSLLAHNFFKQSKR